MTETRTMTLAGTAYSVPPLPIRHNRVIFPICRKLTQDGLIDRCIAANGSLECTGEEFDQMIEIAFLCIVAGGATLSRDEFEQLPITPGELLDAFFIARYQTGAWVALPDPEQEPAQGEAKGPARPRTNRQRK